LAHPGFADAVEKFLEKERMGVNQYVGALKSPFRAEIGD
jgi:predicted N-acyltransferase